MLFLILSLMIAILYSVAASVEQPNGAIITAQMRCTTPCEQNYRLTVSRFDVVQFPGAENDIELAQLLPEAPIGTRSFETFTSFNELTREFVVVGADYPRIASANVWTVKLNGDLSAGSLTSQVEFVYPVSSSPFPLNVLHLKMKRVFHTADGSLYGIYENGEVHLIDLANKQSKMVSRMTSDEQLLGVEYLTATWSHAYDPQMNVLHSTFIGGVNAYYTKTDMASFTNTKWVQMSMPQGANSGFSPETFNNAHMMKDLNTGNNEFVVLLESFADMGFDQINKVNTTDGSMIPYEFNLMEYNVEFTCANVPDCDKLRVSAWDSVGSKLYFQTHDAEDHTSILTVMGFTQNKATKIWYPYVNPALDPFTFGNSGFIFVQKV